VHQPFLSPSLVDLGGYEEETGAYCDLFPAGENFFRIKRDCLIEGRFPGRNGRR